MKASAVLNEPTQEPFEAVPHLVVKRGHRGRFRFVLLDSDDKITGEVYVQLRSGSEDLRALELARIRCLAGMLIMTAGGQRAPESEAHDEHEPSLQHAPTL